MKRVIVTTTVHIPLNLTDYCRDIADSGDREAEILVAGDLRTASGAADFCVEQTRRFGVPVIYLDKPAQDKFLSGFPEYAAFLPWNCIQRRNVAILKAYHDGADNIVTIDDDNFLEVPGYLDAHGPLGVIRSLRVTESSSGWINVCGSLIESRGREFFHRGYSLSQRRLRHPKTVTVDAVGRTVVNAGLSVGEPDIDAVTRLAIAPEVSGVCSTEPLVIAHGTISPFNSQNTALVRDVIPAYCMHVGVGRYDDIIPSYFVKRIADHLGDYISFGPPYVRQNRNPHDPWVDLEMERLGLQLIDHIVEWLYDMSLRGADYGSCLQELLTALRDDQTVTSGLNDDQTIFIRMIERNFRVWLKAIEGADT